MEKNFKIGQSNELIKDNQIYDLHNCFDLEGIILGGAEAEMFFRPNALHGHKYSRIKLHIHCIDYFELSQNFRVSMVVDIDEIGYKKRDDRDDSWLLTESQSQGEADLFFRFVGGHFVRLHGQRITLSEV